MYEFLIKKQADLQKENYLLKAALAGLTSSSAKYRAAYKQYADTLYGDCVPFDLTCPGPRFEDSPEGDCEHCDYCVSGYCMLQDGPDEPTGEPDEIDEYEDTDSVLPVLMDPRTEHAPDLVQTYYDKAGTILFVIRWFVATTPELMSGEYVGDLDHVTGSKPCYEVTVDPDVWEDEEFDVLMDDALQMVELMLGSARCRWQYVVKTEVDYND